MLRFTRIHLQNWRNFKSLEVPLQERAFLVGPNASGKSNFLDAFRFLADLVAVGGGFQQAVQKRGGVSRLRCMAARASSDITVHIQLGDDSNESVWHYALTFNQDKQKRPQLKSEVVVFDGKVVLNRPTDEDKRDNERLTQSTIEQVYANREFRDLAAFFRSVRYMHLVPQLIREPERSLTRSNDPFGGDFLEQIAKTSLHTQQSRLKKIREALGIAIPQLEELKLDKDERGVPHLLARYKHWRPQGMWLNEDQFSDGTLRLMGLLWSMLEGAGPLLLEEPELSLHSGVVRMLPQMFARLTRHRDHPRQILVSSHSNELLRDTGIGVDEVLVFRPSDEGTAVMPANGIPEIAALVGEEISLADTLPALTEPQGLQRFPQVIDR